MQTPLDLSAAALNKMSSVLETQLGYIRQLGTYLSSVLQVYIVVTWISIMTSGIEVLNCVLLYSLIL